MYLFFDTETTGIPRNYKAPVTDLANWPRVIQMACLVTDANGGVMTALQCLIKPMGFIVPADAVRVHGITTERAAAEGVGLAEALQGFLGCLKASQVLVAHNMAYDEKVLGAEFLRAGLGNPLPRARRICTMDVATNFCAIPGKYGFKWPTLSELHMKLFGKDFKGAHGAMPDVEACAKCFFEMKAKRIISV